MAAVNETPTRSLFGLSPHYFQFLQSPHVLDPTQPEDATGGQLRLMLKEPPSFEAYAQRRKARAKLEEMKTDKHVIADFARYRSKFYMQHSIYMSSATLFCGSCLYLEDKN